MYDDEKGTWIIYACEFNIIQFYVGHFVVWLAIFYCVPNDFQPSLYIKERTGDWPGCPRVIDQTTTH